MKFTRNRSRVQPTPPVCKKPPIPKPPSDPIECVAATAYWNGQTQEGSSFFINAVLTLPRRAHPYAQWFIGQTTIGPLTLLIDASFEHDYSAVSIFATPIIAGVPHEPAIAYKVSQRTNPLDTGTINLWTPLPNNTTIEVRLRG